MDLLGTPNRNEEKIMTKKNQNRLWFAIVMGMLSFGIYMVIWTVKQAVSIPVQESNNYMQKYQMADMNMNQIMELEAKFNAKYNIKLNDTTFVELDDSLKNTNAKRVQSKPIKLTMGKNSFSYTISTKDGQSVKNANVSFLLTRPHTREDDALEENVTYKDGHYATKPITLTKKGRYTLQLKVTIDKIIGYSEVSAYLID